LVQRVGCAALEPCLLGEPAVEVAAGVLKLQLFARLEGLKASGRSFSAVVSDLYQSSRPTLIILSLGLNWTMTCLHAPQGLVKSSESPTIDIETSSPRPSEMALKIAVLSAQFESP